MLYEETGLYTRRCPLMSRSLEDCVVLHLSRKSVFQRSFMGPFKDLLKQNEESLRSWLGNCAKQIGRARRQLDVHKGSAFPVEGPYQGPAPAGSNGNNSLILSRLSSARQETLSGREHWQTAVGVLALARHKEAIRRRLLVTLSL